MSDQYEIRPMTDADLNQVAKLEADVYGPGRFARTAYRLREGGAQRSELCTTAWAKDELAGSVRFTHVNITNKSTQICNAALLGPLTVSTNHTGHNLGLRLINAAIKVAKTRDVKALILIGDVPYYGKAGFKPVPHGRLTLPGPVDPARLLILEIDENIAAGCEGEIKAAENNSKAIT